MVNDIEKAMERERLRRLAQSEINNTPSNVNSIPNNKVSRSTNTTKIHFDETQLDGYDKGIEQARERHSRNNSTPQHTLDSDYSSDYNANVNNTSNNKVSESVNTTKIQFDDVQLDGYGKNVEQTREKHSRNNSTPQHTLVSDNSNDYNTKVISPNIKSNKSQACILPFEDMQNAGYITPKTKKGRLTEEYRRIKRPLLQNIRNEIITNGLSNVIAVTSAVSGEGKTYSTVNLAMSMALEKERTVLLVDADVVKGETGKLFSVSPNQPGLTDVLFDDSIDISDVIMKTNVKNMRFMPAGKNTANTSELLSSDAMSDLIVELARRYDDRIIILDCPPILQTNEANILVDHAGQIVFVVAEEQTRQKLVTSAMEQIDSEKYVGVLLNKSSSRIGNYDYYRRPYT